VTQERGQEERRLTHETGAGEFAAEDGFRWATRIATESGYTIRASVGIEDVDAYAIAQFVEAAEAGVHGDREARFDEAAVREHIREAGGNDTKYTGRTLRLAVGDYRRLRRGDTYARELPPSNEASATTETQIVWPRDSVRLQFEAPPGSRTRWRAWAQGDVGTVLRSAGRGDWTVQLESDAGKREVHVPGHELRLLHERAFAAGDVVIATRSLQHATEEGSAGGRTPRPSALLLLRRAPDDDTRRGANWHAYQWHPGALTVVNEGDVARAPWQAHSRQSGGTPQPTEAREALVAIAQRVYAQMGEWEGETVSATRSAAAREGHHIDAAEANRAIQEAKRRWRGGRSCARMATLNHGGILVRLRETTAAIPGQRRMATAPSYADAAALAWEADGRLHSFPKQV